MHGTVIQSPIQTFDEQSQNYHWTQKTYQIIPLFHPAAVFYNYRLKEVVKEDWQVVQKQRSKMVLLCLLHTQISF